MTLIKLVGRSFAVCRKSARTVKVFFCIIFIVYGNHSRCLHGGCEAVVEIVKLHSTSKSLSYWKGYKNKT